MKTIEKMFRKWFLHNGSIINHLHKEDTINNFAKEAYIAGGLDVLSEIEETFLGDYDNIDLFLEAMHNKIQDLKK